MVPPKPMLCEESSMYGVDQKYLFHMIVLMVRIGQLQYVLFIIIIETKGDGSTPSFHAPGEWGIWTKLVAFGERRHQHHKPLDAPLRGTIRASSSLVKGFALVIEIW